MMDYKITIKPTTDTALFAQCAQMMAQSDPWITMEIDFEQCLKGFEGFWREVHVLEFEEKVAGFIVIQPYGTFKGYIQTLCVDELHRGKGFGKKLLEYAENLIFKTSPNIFICVSSFNHGAIKLYKNWGFEPVGELQNFVKQGFTELLLRKTIGPMMGNSSHKK